MFLPLNSLAFQITHFFHALNRGAGIPAHHHESRNHGRQTLHSCMRVTVGMILQEQDICEALAFAANLAQGHEIRLAS
jgi:hypothetical protein